MSSVGYTPEPACPPQRGCPPVRRTERGLLTQRPSLRRPQSTCNSDSTLFGPEYLKPCTEHILCAFSKLFSSELTCLCGSSELNTEQCTHPLTAGSSDLKRDVLMSTTLQLAQARVYSLGDTLQLQPMDPSRCCVAFRWARAVSRGAFGYLGRSRFGCRGHCCYRRCCVFSWDTHVRTSLWRIPKGGIPGSFIIIFRL